MKVIFLDIDGVLNSSGTFIYESGLRRKNRKDKFPYKLSEHMNDVLCSNFNEILKRYPHVKIVISSSWRNLRTMDFIKARLEYHGVDSSRIIGKTPYYPGLPRGLEIEDWLKEYPFVTKFVIIDDNSDMANLKEHLVQTKTEDGLVLSKAQEVIEKLRTR